MTHKRWAVGKLVVLDELVDVPIVHPLGNQRELMFTYCDPKQP